LSSVRRSNGVGDASRHLVRRTDMLPEFGSIIFWRFATLWQDALLHSGPAPAAAAPEPSREARGRDAYS